MNEKAKYTHHRSDGQKQISISLSASLIEKGTRLARWGHIMDAPPASNTTSPGHPRVFGRAREHNIRRRQGRAVHCSRIFGFSPNPRYRIATSKRLPSTRPPAGDTDPTARPQTSPPRARRPRTFRGCMACRPACGRRIGSRAGGHRHLGG